MAPFFLVLFACGCSIFGSDMIPTVSGDSDPYQAGNKNNLAATVGQSSGVDLLSPPFCELAMDGATLERDMFATSTSYYSTSTSAAVRRRGNRSSSCAAVGVAGLLIGEADDSRLYCRIGPRHERDGTDSLSFQSFQGMFLVSGTMSLLVTLYWVIAGLWWLRKRTRRSRGEEQEQDDQELGREVSVPRRYRYGEVAAATGNFAESRRIGRGGFGAVFRGFLSDAAGRGVAVKALSPESAEQGRREFEAEVRIVGRLRHRNLVQLLGWCDCRRGLFLVYELVPDGSLDSHLHSPDRLLSWSERYMISLDLGSAILYLHTEWEQRVVHGDIKPSNVMLDSSRRAKLGDFGMARLVNHGAKPRTTRVVAGTVGYIDPEFINTRRPSTESDVYSFGVVLLEIASGRRPTATAASSEQPGRAPALLRRVRDMHSRDAILDAADGRLNGLFDREQMERVLVTGLWCAHRDPSQRPSISQAMAALRCEGGGLPVMTELHGSAERIRDMEEQAYRDLSNEVVSPSTRLSDATVYHTPEGSSSETED